MKTSLVFKPFGDRGYMRAMTPSDSPDNYRDVPSYIAAHVANGRNEKGQKNWNEPESVWVKSNGVRPSRGKVNELRTMDVDYVAELESIDAERAELEEKLKALADRQRDVLENAYMRGKPVKLEDVKAWKAERTRRYEQQTMATA